MSKLQFELLNKDLWCLRSGLCVLRAIKPCSPVVDLGELWRGGEASSHRGLHLYTLLQHRIRDSFCYQCISQWLSFVASKHSNPLSSFECPLCKSKNMSIIHGVNGQSFRRHYVNENIRSLSNAHILRLNFYTTQKDFRNKKPDVVQYWKNRKYLQKNNWLQNWLRREIQALMQEENVEIIFCHIYGVIESFMKRQVKESLRGAPEQKRKEFRDLLENASRPFLQNYTDRFVSELELFLASGLNLNAYDKYLSHEATENDSDEDNYFMFLGDDTDDLTD